MQVEGVEKSEVDEAEDGGVELDEDRHQAHVHTSRLGETKTMRDDPSHSLTFDFSLGRKCQRRSSEGKHLFSTWK